VPADKTANEIVSLLGRKGATAVMMEFDAGEVGSLSWQVKTPHGELPFRLPANIAAVRKVLERQGVGRKDPQEALDQARRVAWRILKTWVMAQMALLETEMVTLDQLFLPYLCTGGGATLYDYMVGTGFKQLAAGSP